MVIALTVLALCDGKQTGKRGIIARFLSSDTHVVLFLTFFRIEITKVKARYTNGRKYNEYITKTKNHLKLSREYIYIYIYIYIYMKCGSRLVYAPASFCACSFDNLYEGWKEKLMQNSRTSFNIERKTYDIMSHHSTFS